MGKIIVITLFTAMLLSGWGCQSKQTEISLPPPPPVEIDQPQQEQTITPPAIITESPKPAAEPAPEPAKIETPKPSEPDTKIAADACDLKKLAEDAHDKVIIKPATQETPPKAVEANNVIENKAATNSPLAPDELCKKFTAFISKFVDKDGLVDYKALLRKKIELHDIIDTFKNIDKKTYSAWSQDDKIAFWINAYNLEITKIIVDNYPIQPTRMLLLFWPPNSIRHIKGIWDEHKFIMMGEEFTLKSVEDQIFRKEFNEPRMFLAISYASVSGPPMRNEAYCGQNLSQQLDDQVKRFTLGSHAFKIDRVNKVVYLSSIFKIDWHGQDFIKKYGTDLKFKNQEPAVRAVLNFLTNYLPADQADFLETANYSVEYMIYDWTLNERGASKTE